MTSKKTQNNTNSKSVDLSVQKDESQKQQSDLHLNLPDSYKKFYEDMRGSEEQIEQIDEQMENIQAQLKPISRVEKLRGKRSDLTTLQRKHLKVQFEQLKRQRFSEKVIYNNSMREFRGKAQNIIAAVKQDFSLEKARSSLYVKRSRHVITGKFKRLFDDVQSEDKKKITVLRTAVSGSRAEEKKYEAVQTFLENNEEEKFLLTVFKSHKEYRGELTTFIQSLLKDWSEKKAKSFSFKELAEKW